MKQFTWALLAVLAAVVLFAGCGGGSSSSSKGDTVKVPDVAGKPLPQARKTLEGLGFKVKADAPDSTFGVVDESHWVVKSQDKTGSVEKGATVTLTVERPEDKGGDDSAGPTTTLIHGQALVDAIRSQSMDNDPMMLPLVDAQWKGGFLVLTYQSDDAQQAADLCNFVHLNAAPGLTPEETKQVQVVGPDGKELAITRLSGPGCKAKD